MILSLNDSVRLPISVIIILPIMILLPSWLLAIPLAAFVLCVPFVPFH